MHLSQGICLNECLKQLVVEKSGCFKKKYKKFIPEYALASVQIVMHLFSNDLVEINPPVQVNSSTVDLGGLVIVENRVRRR